MEGDEQQQIAQALNRANDWTNSISYIDGDAGKYQQFHHKAGGPAGAGEKDGPGKTQFPRQLPANYVCYRCGKPGHYILNCPTNGDPNFNGKMIKRGGPGIPISFMTKITPEEAEKRPGAMLMQDGQYYVTNPNLKALEPMKANAAQLREDNRKVPDALKCPLCSKLLRAAMQLRTCCGASFCEECIRPDDGESTVHCPICKRNNQLRGLVPNHELREKVDLFQRDPQAYLRQAASAHRDDHPEQDAQEQSDEDDKPLFIPLVGGAMAKPQQPKDTESQPVKQAQQPTQMKNEPIADDRDANDYPQQPLRDAGPEQEYHDDGVHVLPQHAQGRGDYYDQHQSRGLHSNNRGYSDQGQYRQPYQQQRQYQQQPRQYQNNYQHYPPQHYPPQQNYYQNPRPFQVPSRNSLDEYVVIDPKKADHQQQQAKENSDEPHSGNEPIDSRGQPRGNPSYYREQPYSNDSRYRGPGSANWQNGDQNYRNDGYNNYPPQHSHGDRNPRSGERRDDRYNERRDERSRGERRDSRDRSRERDSREREEYEKERVEQIARTKGLISRSSQAYFEREGRDDSMETEAASEAKREELRSSEKVNQSHEMDEDSPGRKEKSEKEREADRTRARILAERQHTFERADRDRQLRAERDRDWERKKDRERDDWERKNEREEKQRENERDRLFRDGGDRRYRDRGSDRRDSRSRSSSRDRYEDDLHRRDERRERDSKEQARKRDRSDSEGSREERRRRRHSGERDRSDANNDKHSHKKRRHETESERDERKASERLRRKEREKERSDKPRSDKDSESSRDGMESERDERKRSDKSDKRRHKHGSHKSHHRSSSRSEKHRESSREEGRDSRRDRKDKRDSDKEPEREGRRRVVMIHERKEKIEEMKVEKKGNNEPISVDSRSEG